MEFLCSELCSRPQYPAAYAHLRGSDQAWSPSSKRITACTTAPVDLRNSVSWFFNAKPSRTLCKQEDIWRQTLCTSRTNEELHVQSGLQPLFLSSFLTKLNVDHTRAEICVSLFSACLKVNIMNRMPLMIEVPLLSGSWASGWRIVSLHTALPLVNDVSIVCGEWHSLCQSPALLQWCWDSAGCGALDESQLSLGRSRRTEHSESPTKQKTWT